MHHSNKTIKTVPVESKQAAYEVGFAKLNELKGDSAAQLSAELALPLSSYQKKTVLAWMTALTSHCRR
ncbi:hypothetical protein [Psychromonas sp.]|uniref:hypothetical protein n=1 Tax=Psychromonas sp. TaxID=1884585 RepID=UPI00356284FF